MKGIEMGNIGYNNRNEGGHEDSETSSAESNSDQENLIQLLTEESSPFTEHIKNLTDTQFRELDYCLNLDGFSLQDLKYETNNDEKIGNLLSTLSQSQDFAASQKIIKNIANLLG
jgi:beta-lactam-binding protein with PASTA domain